MLVWHRQCYACWAWGVLLTCSLRPVHSSWIDLQKTSPGSASVTDRDLRRETAAPTGGDDDPYTLSFRGIDNSTYYMLDKAQYVQLLNYSGCGNSISGNHPQVKQMIIDACKQ